MKKALIVVDRVSHGYGEQTVLQEISLAFSPGEIVSLLGPNGSGKTTLLKLILGFYRPRRGRVLVDGEPVTRMGPRRLARRIAYVPQIHRQAFGYRVEDVVIMGRLARKPQFFRYNDADRRIARQALERMGISHLTDRPYTEISGGERQMVLIARALAQGAQIFVMDEPVNGLDYGNQVRLLERIADLARSGLTFIKTTHFPDHALWISDRVVMIKKGEIIADGPARQVINDANLFKLYQTRVHVLDLASGGRCCFPGAMVRSS